MRRIIYKNLKNLNISITKRIALRSYSHSEFEDWFRFAKNCTKGIECSCLAYMETHTDSLLDLHLPWHTLWFLHAKDIPFSQDDNNYIVLWSHCFSIRSNDYLTPKDNESINKPNGSLGPYNHCAKDCCKAIEEL